jgi:hypothetical protein
MKTILKGTKKQVVIGHGLPTVILGGLTPLARRNWLRRWWPAT